jgi:hypothetical protein
MKKSIVIVVFFISNIAFSQVGLKGVELGGYSSINEKVTTVGGLPGILMLDTMKNEKIWKITFSSTKSYRSENNKFDQIDFYNDFRELIQGTEDNYMISFGIDDIRFEDIIEIRSMQFETTKNGVEYIISTHMERKNNKEWILFSLRSLRLDHINRNENPNKHDY